MKGCEERVVCIEHRNVKMAREEMICTNAGTAYRMERTIIYNNGRCAARAGHKAKGKEEAGSEEGKKNEMN